MKIIEKIVTSVTQPPQINVMWHNPDTGEFKIFGSNGWEIVGGNSAVADNVTTLTTIVTNLEIQLSELVTTINGLTDSITTINNTLGTMQEEINALKSVE